MLRLTPGLITIFLASLFIVSCGGSSSTDGSSTARYSLEVQLSGSGEVTPTSGEYDENSSVTITATAQNGWVFSGWSGDVSATDNPLTLTMDADKSIIASFSQQTNHTSWNETAVRKVLQTFAWGGHPTDAQIAIWAAIDPEIAIKEMLTFEPINNKLSPPDSDSLGTKIAANIPVGGGQLEGIAMYFNADPDQLLNDSERREEFHTSQWESPLRSWEIAVRATGLNTFYHRVGFWETNYHMAANQTAGVFPYPMIRHYDNIMGKLSSDVAYDEVLAQGALNAAIAYQYGHNYNEWDNVEGIFYGNEDFAREFHQLFFGILGDVNFGGEAYHQNHELVSIKNTAKVLTGLNAYWHDEGEGGPDIEIEFDSEINSHHQANLMVLDKIITGYSAREKIVNLAAEAIMHPESLNNLPVMIVSGLADDKLTPEKISTIRQMWAQLPEKNLLAFIRAYAISDLFHSSDRVRYHTSFGRNLFIHNQMQLGNAELYLGEAGLNPVGWLFYEDDVIPFNPVHNVFGHQGSIEAFNSPEIFKNAYNRSTEHIWYYVNGTNTELPVKDWQKIIPKNNNDEWPVKEVARWIWQRFIADGLKNFGVLEQAHLYALLGSETENFNIQGVDLGFYLDKDNPDKVYESSELETEPLVSIITSLGEQTLQLDHVDIEKRLAENRKIQRAIAFIAATPYSYLQEGK